MQDPDEEIARVDKTVKSQDSSQVGLLNYGAAFCLLSSMLSFFQVSQTRAAGHMAEPRELVSVAWLLLGLGLWEGFVFLK